MKNFDEYQLFLRHRNGYNAFNLIWILLFINSVIFRVTKTNWGETREVELLIILLLSATYFNITNTRQGAYFKKWEQPIWVNLAFLFFGLFYMLAFYIWASSPSGGLVSEGKVTMVAVVLLAGLVLLSTPLTYFIKYFIDRNNREL